MQVGLYHPLFGVRRTVSEDSPFLKPPQDLGLVVPALPAVVHFPPYLQDLLDPFQRLMAPRPDDLSDLAELAEVPLLLRREEAELLEERNHVLQDSG